ncbi:MAG: ATP synthase F1 subunit gamma [Nitrospirae bacterium]|nr:ATP synthase F1 subunit gamma [Nitrospirota bacterium]
MPNLQHIKRRIGSVKNTQQITKAMKMVAAAKLKRAQDRILEARPYAQKMLSVLGNLSERVERESHPLLAKRGDKKIEVMIVTSDRGLCGAFNANIIRKSFEFLREKRAEGCEITLNAVGRKGRDFYRRRDFEIRKAYAGIFDRLSYQNASEIGVDIVESYEKGLFDELYVVYNEFKSAMQQRVIIEKLLPIEPSVETEIAFTADYIFEPSAKVILHSLLPKHIEVQTFRILLESNASEYGARMTAMEAATKNAKELIKKLTLVYNRTRQSMITKELMDIINGSEALK